MISKKELIDFEEEMAGYFGSAKIGGPLHLADGNEDQLIEWFKQISPDDWVFSTWRSHYHALLHGIEPEWLKKRVLSGESITVINSKHNFFSSAIVGGTMPISVGTALGLKLSNSPLHVWTFVGDMCAETGIFYENVKYAENFDLPITFLVEDNGVSTTTPTRMTWGLSAQEQVVSAIKQVSKKVWRYSYIKDKYPHQGTGVFINF